MNDRATNSGRVKNENSCDTATGRETKKNEAKDLNKELKGTFPASDPLAITQPGGGITGPEDMDKKH